MSDSAQTLRDSLSRTAAAERERIAAEADQKAASILAAAEAEAAALRARALDRLESEIADEDARTNGEAKLAENARLLSMKRALMDEVYAAAAARLGAPSDARYGQAIARLAVQAAELLLASAAEDSGPAGEIRVRNADRAEVSAALARAGLGGRIVLAAQTEKGDLSAGSVIASRPDGGLSIDNGFSTRLERSRDRFLPEVASILFGGASG